MEDTSEKQVAPKKKGLNRTELIVLLVIAGLFIWSWYKQAFTNPQLGIMAVVIIVLIFVFRRFTDTKQNIIPIEYQEKKLIKFIQDRQNNRHFNYPKGKFWIEPGFTRIKYAGQYSKDLFSVFFRTNKSEVVTYIATYDPNSKGPGSIGFFKANEGFDPNKFKDREFIESMERLIEKGYPLEKIIGTAK